MASTPSGNQDQAIERFISAPGTGTASTVVDVVIPVQISAPLGHERTSMEDEVGSMIPGGQHPETSTTEAQEESTEHSQPPSTTPQTPEPQGSQEPTQPHNDINTNTEIQPQSQDYTFPHHHQDPTQQTPITLSTRIIFRSRSHRIAFFSAIFNAIWIELAALTSVACFLYVWFWKLDASTFVVRRRRWRRPAFIMRDTEEALSFERPVVTGKGKGDGKKDWFRAVKKWGRGLLRGVVWAVREVCGAYGSRVGGIERGVVRVLIPGGEEDGAILPVLEGRGFGAPDGVGGESGGGMAVVVEAAGAEEGMDIEGGEGDGAGRGGDGGEDIGEHERERELVLPVFGPSDRHPAADTHDQDVRLAIGAADQHTNIDTEKQPDVETDGDDDGNGHQGASGDHQHAHQAGGLRRRAVRVADPPEQEIDLEAAVVAPVPRRVGGAYEGSWMQRVIEWACEDGDGMGLGLG